MFAAAASEEDAEMDRSVSLHGHGVSCPVGHSPASSISSSRLT